MAARPGAFAIKVAVADMSAARFDFPDEKTMYAGRTIAAGDTIYLFASETHGGTGLFARGLVTASTPVPPRFGIARQTPRVSITVARIGTATAPLGWSELRPFRGEDGAEGELDFKLYRQATDKIVGLTAGAAAFLATLF